MSAIQWRSIEPQIHFRVRAETKSVQRTDQRICSPSTQLRTTAHLSPILRCFPIIDWSLFFRMSTFQQDTKAMVIFTPSLIVPTPRQCFFYFSKYMYLEFFSDQFQNQWVWCFFARLARRRRKILCFLVVLHRFPFEFQPFRDKFVQEFSRCPKNSRYFPIFQIEVPEKKHCLIVHRASTVSSSLLISTNFKLSCCCER